MIGSVFVLTQEEYRQWLESGTNIAAPSNQGENIFIQQGCRSCHGEDVRIGPPLERLFGSRVSLEGGQEVVADEAYIRESILNPTAKIVRGYQPVMPPYQGVLTEEEVM